MMRLLYVESKQIVGIHGMGGIGKTTIARATFNKICSHFDGCSFLADVRSTCQQPRDLVYLQNKLISDILDPKEQNVTDVDEGIKVIRKRFSNKRILLVIDDVDHDRQLKALAGKGDWFGLGSRVIVTTRDRHVLYLYGVDGIYEPKEMDLNQSIQLFSQHAFRRDQPPEDYVDISQKVAQTTGGLPLALETIGSFLFLKPKSVWEETLKKLKKKPDAQVRDKLRISYDGLDDDAKAIFLDIACFFIGTDKEIATQIWSGSDFFPESGICILQLKSLVKIDGKNKFWMHDQLRDLGREIVREENPLEPGERSRLWSHEEALNVLKTETGTRKVEGLHLDFGYASKDHYLKSEGFQAMAKLRLLRIDYTYLVGNFEHLFSKLRWLSWKGCPLEFAPANFHLEELVVLDLSQSKVTEDWKGWKQIKKSSTLKVLNLTDCCLNKTPDFSAFSNLEILILECCGSLSEINDSIGHLKSLVFLNLDGCDSLVELPTSICKLSSLQNFHIECANLQKLPTELGLMKGLTKLIIDNAIRMEQLPESIGLLKKLKTLSAKYCAALTELPNSIGNLKSLLDLVLDGTRISVLPDSIGLLQKLRCLSLRGCFLLKKIPDSIGGLVSLEKLDLLGINTSEIPDSIGNIRNLTFLRLDLTDITGLPDSVGLLEKLEVLSTRHCKRLVKQPGSVGRLRHLQHFEMYLNDWRHLPADFEALSNLKKLSIGGLKTVESESFLESLGSLCALEELLVYNWAISEGETLGDIGRLSSLKILKLENSNFFNLPTSICNLPLLRSLEIRNCPNLQSLPKLPSTLRVLEAEDNSSIETFSDISNLTNLEEMNLRFCRKLVEIPTDIGNLTKLESLHLGKSDIFTLPPSINALNRLKVLDIHSCGKLKSIPELPSSLIELNAVCCMSMERLPNLSNLKRLKHLRLDGCLELVEIQGLEELEHLVTLTMAHCKLITRVPDLMGLTDLNTLCLDFCEMLMEIECLDGLESLDKLSIKSGTSLERLPNLSSLEKLEELQLPHCNRLVEIEGLERLQSLKKLDLYMSTSIERLPDLSNLKKLEELHIDGCKKLTEIQGSNKLESLRIFKMKGCASLRSLDFSSLKKLEKVEVSYCSKMTDIKGLEGREHLITYKELEEMEPISC
ncbi:disease resistance protein RPV1-like isoform X2 [Macadamia integrifolia]|nr:disease resistance protein RPV1-like isoform X2 [Macadamia integrifolia]